MIRVTRTYGEGDKPRVEMRFQTRWEGEVKNIMLHLRAELVDVDMKSPNHIFKSVVPEDPTGYIVLEAE